MNALDLQTDLPFNPDEFKGEKVHSFLGKNNWF